MSIRRNKVFLKLNEFCCLVSTLDFDKICCIIVQLKREKAKKDKIKGQIVLFNTALIYLFNIPFTIIYFKETKKKLLKLK